MGCLPFSVSKPKILAHLLYMRQRQFRNATRAAEAIQQAKTTAVPRSAGDSRGAMDAGNILEPGSLDHRDRLSIRNPVRHGAAGEPAGLALDLAQPVPFHRPDH